MVFLARLNFMFVLPFAALAVIGELERVRVGHRSSSLRKPPGQFSLAAEVAFGVRIKAVEKAVVTVEDVIRIVKQVHYEAAVGHREVTRRFAATGVEVLVVGVERHREHASRSPFKGMLLAVALPHTGRAVTFGHVHHLFVHMPLRLDFAAGGNLTHVGIVACRRCRRAQTIEQGSALQIPVFELEGC